nr:MAG TPA: hypothetical protein [Caudoviricetes sp.]
MHLLISYISITISYIYYFKQINIRDLYTVNYI